ncbi:hypothetical protein EXIGLDRAFT_725230 [Exidia glandulosa HHB12029]|uniref:Ubiquitin 3 binding protein But2 C-terminal domain-containing protein n=1 Tax=Exidia glandulosa HHB12029 TaxID=1314781 RepID=A0A165E4F5_EXIGL|nr:hypothetical protein EXIGLDRAFT_725230 [Exidia glandulosa HHB12029]
MILQFRVIDHKMERCAVVADIPTEAQIRARDRDNNIDLDGDTTVQVYRLDTQRTLKRSEISYASRPPRRELVGDFRVSMGALNGTVEFDCKERSLQTFEVVCPAAPCRINFWQNREKPIMGNSLLCLPLSTSELKQRAAFYLRQTHSLVEHPKQ